MSVSREKLREFIRNRIFNDTYSNFESFGMAPNAEDRRCLFFEFSEEAARLNDDEMEEEVVRQRALFRLRRNHSIAIDHDFVSYAEKYADLMIKDILKSL